MSPFIANSILQCPKLLSYDTSSLKTCVIGGGVVNKTQLLYMRSVFSHTSICLCYGMTENLGDNTRFDPVDAKEEMYKKINSVGRGLPGYSYKVYLYHLLILSFLLISNQISRLLIWTQKKF